MGLPETRKRRSIAEKRRIVGLTFLPGQSVARVAQAEGVNSHQVFQWRRAFKRGELGDPDAAATALLPVTLSSPRAPNHGTPRSGAKERPAAGGSIHIEFPRRVVISVESGADAVLLRSILESLRK